MVFDQMRKGDLTAARLIIEQAWGRAPQGIEFLNQVDIRGVGDKIVEALKEHPEAAKAVATALGYAEADQERAEQAREDASVTRVRK
jgi:hypothetical protein